MLLEALRLLLVLAAFVLLPGWLLVSATFPRPGALRVSERVYLSIAGGMLLAILVGVILGFLPHEGKGHFSTLATGMPSFEVGMVLVSLGLLWIGMQRGAHAWLRARIGPAAGAPSGAAPAASQPADGRKDP